MKARSEIRRHARQLAQEYAGSRCTLNGSPAMVSGMLGAYATVIDIATLMGAEYSWQCVALVMEHKEGKFRA